MYLCALSSAQYYTEYDIMTVNVVTVVQSKDQRIHNNLCGAEFTGLMEIYQGWSKVTPFPLRLTKTTDGINKE